MARLDKFIWAVRLYKTRTLASSACKNNQVSINGEVAKPSKNIKVNDIISLKKNAVVFKYKVVLELEKRVGAKLVQDYILDVTEPDQVEKFKTILATKKVYREHGLGRPTKKDRRDINKFFER